MKCQERVIINENIHEDNRKVIAAVEKSLKDQDLQLFMSKTKHIRRNANRIRSRKNPSCASSDDLETIPEQFCTMDNGPFLRLNSKTTNGGRIMMFASEAGIDLLRNSKEWHGDGTFSTSTTLFYQVYPIFAQVESSKHLVPCVYTLLPDKTAETYEVPFKFRDWIIDKLSSRGGGSREIVKRVPVLNRRAKRTKIYFSTS